MTKNITVGVVGMHGYAHTHLDDLLRLREEGLVGRLSAVAHNRDLDPAWANHLANLGVHLVSDFDALLAEPGLQLVTLPVGIDLHLTMAQRALAAGFKVLLEKPVAGCLSDFDRLASDPRADHLVIGFQHLFLPGVRELGRRIANGDFGALRRIVVSCRTPRDRAYFTRNHWAGRLAVDDITVHDSPANNACAHHLNLALFFAGGDPRQVRAALARANPIESFDTCGLRVRMPGDVEVVFNATHAGEAYCDPRVRIECAQATINGGHPGKPWFIGGTPLSLTGAGSAFVFRHTIGWMDGGVEPVCTVGEARAHARIIEAIHHSPINTLPSSVVEERPASMCCPVLDAAIDNAHSAGMTLDEGGMIPGLIAGDWTACPP